jgi:hypothetical protein
MSFCSGCHVYFYKAPVILSAHTADEIASFHAINQLHSTVMPQKKTPCHITDGGPLKFGKAHQLQ